MIGRGTAARLGAAVLLCAVVAAGCNQPVREDRAMSWTAGGDRGGFQHGPNGVFLTDPKGGPPVLIHKPGPEVIAVGAPQWSPDGRKVVFTTARSAQPAAPAGQPQPAEPRAEGGVVTQTPAVYTCWLYDETDPAPRQAKALFEAPCGHPGYVAANLAVRWHPAGDRILHVREEPNSTQHALYAFDLVSKAVQPFFTQAADDLVFDIAPGGESLACVLGSRQTPPQPGDGVWIVPLNGSDAWHLPGTGDLGWAELPSLLEKLKATRPVWASGGRRFAVPGHQPDPQPERFGRSLLRVGSPADRSLVTWLEDDQPLRELHWSLDGKRLGLVRGWPAGRLHLIAGPGPLPQPVGPESVRHFAGWDGASGLLAYVADDPLPLRDGLTWAYLMRGNPAARETVYAAGGDGRDPGRRLVSGLHATFPRWTGAEAKLSLWLTFEPPYTLDLRSGGLRPGDPAATLDARGGALSWLPTSPTEQAQLGHWHALRREFAEAARWYEQAAKGRDAAADDGGLLPFEAFALKHLGRAAKARARLDRFRQLAAAPGGQAVNPNGGPSLADVWRDKDRYAAEAFLSLDAPDEAVAFLRESLKAAPGDDARLHSAVALAQVLLLQNRRAEYADFLTDTAMPLWLKVWPATEGAWREEVRGAMLLTVAPLATPEFLAALPKDAVRALPERWQRLRDPKQDPVGHLLIDVVREGAWRQLGNEAERAAAERSLKANPMSGAVMPQGLAEAVKQWRQTREAMEQLMRMMQ
jgi:tetratricopeptide (TPR) repeat protein